MVAMKKFLIGIGVLVVLIVIAAVAAPALIPVDTYKAEILSRVEAATGRAARIDGDFKLSVLPSLEFVAGKVSLANAPGQSPPQMATLDKLTVKIAMLPLLHGAVVIDSFVLDKPVIALSVDKSGTPNWQFGKTAASPAPAPAQPPAAPAGGGGARLAGLTLGDVRIVDGQAIYSDARTGAKYQADAINMKVSLPSLSSPMKADGSVVWNQEMIALTLGVANPNALLDGQTTAVDAKISGNPLTVAFKGDVANAKVLSARGGLDLAVPSVRKLAAWAGKPLTAPGSGFGPLKISGTVAVTGAKAEFSKATLALDDIKGSGDFRFDGSGPRPYASAQMAFGTLDLNPYLPPQPAGEASSAPAAPSAAPKAAGQPAEWSDEPIDLSGLRAADADLDLGVDGLVVRKIKVGKSHLAVTLKNGKLTADLTDIALYQGHGKANVIADASQSVPTVGLNFALADFQANPFLSDAMDMNRLEGTADANLDATGRGASQRAIVSSLNGNGKVEFKNGAIRGINLAAMVRNIQGAFLDAQAREQQKTDFSELGGTFTIRNGILSNDDMALQSPLLRAAGKGTIDLPKRTVDYRIEPKVVASTEGQGGKGDIAGLMVPVVIQGPWENLSYRPDLSAAIGNIAKNPPKSLDDLKKLIPGADKGGTSPQVGQAPAGQPQPSQPQNPVDTLKKMFGK
jgi:AsmA protein